MSNGKIILGAIAGLAIGGIVGMLFAPEKGSRTRRKIVSKSEDYMDDIKEKLSDYVENIKDTCEHAMHQAEQVISKENLVHAENNKAVS